MARLRPVDPVKDEDVTVVVFARGGEFPAQVTAVHHPTHQSVTVRARTTPYARRLALARLHRKVEQAT